MDIKTNKTRVTELMLNSQLGYSLEHNNTKYQVTIDYVGESVLLGTSSITLYLNRKKFASVTLNNLILTYKREVNDLVNNEPKLFSLAIDTFDLLIDENKIDDSRIDQRLLVFLYLMGDLNYLSSQGNLTTISVDKINVYYAMDRLINNLTLSRYPLQIHTRILKEFLDKTRDQYITPENTDNTETEIKPKTKLTKVQIEQKLNKQINKIGKIYKVSDDTSEYFSLSEIANTYDLM